MMKCTKEGLEQRGSADMSMVSQMLTALIQKLAKVLLARLGGVELLHFLSRSRTMQFPPIVQN